MKETRAAGEARPADEPVREAGSAGAVGAAVDGPGAAIGRPGAQSAPSVAGAADEHLGEGLRGVGLTHRYGRRGSGGVVFADLDVRIGAGELVGLVGPSGVGKSTLARLLAGLAAPTTGRVLLDGVPLPTRRGRLRPDIALVGQNPREATDPRWTLRRIIAEPGAIAGRCRADGRGDRRGDGRDDVVGEAADRCFLEPMLLDRRPHEVSAGQLQRACLARALVQQPRFLVCDEPTSMLDPITTAGIMAVVRDRVTRGAGALLISHDHRLIAACADRALALTPTPAGARLGAWEAGAIAAPAGDMMGTPRPCGADETRRG